MELADKTLSLSANVWENFSKMYSELKPGDVVKVTGSMDDYLGIHQIKIISIKTADPADKIIPADFLVRSKRNVEEMKNALIKRLQKISNSKLMILMDQFFNEKNLLKFTSAPAGKYWHHSYLSGLLEHSLELIRICDLMCDIHPEINREDRKSTRLNSSHLGISYAV